MTKERIEEISKALMEDESKIKEMFEMTPEDAAKAFAEKGFNFTAEELVEYGDCLTKVKAHAETNDELSEGQLDDVAGGSAVATVLFGIAFGYWIYTKW